MPEKPYNALQQAFDAVVSNRKLTKHEKHARVMEKLSRLVVQPATTRTIDAMRRLQQEHPKEVMDSVFFRAWIEFNRDDIIRIVYEQEGRNV